MVYINDVSENDGPFEYVDKGRTRATTELRERALRSKGDPILDDEMRRHVPNRIGTHVWVRRERS